MQCLKIVSRNITLSPGWTDFLRTVFLSELLLYIIFKELCTQFDLCYILISIVVDSLVDSPKVLPSDL